MIDYKAILGKDACRLSDGRHLALSIFAEEKTNKRGDGEYLLVSFKIIKGSGDGHIVDHFFNLKNPVESVRNNSIEMFRQFVKAAGIDSFDKKEDALNKVVYIDVYYDAHTMRHRITGFYPASESDKKFAIDVMDEYLDDAVKEGCPF